MRRPDFNEGRNFNDWHAPDKREGARKDGRGFWSPPILLLKGVAMWIAKGTLLALWLFGFGTMAYFYFAIYRLTPPHSSVDIRVITALTTQNPLWWTAFVVCLVLGFVIARSWRGPLGVWIALFVTGLIPAGCLALFLVLVYKLKQIGART